MGIKKIPYLIWFSAKSLVLDLVEFLGAFKRAKTWSFILYAGLFLIMYYKKLTQTNAIIIISLILIIYIIRQNKEPSYNKALKEKIFLKNDEEQIKVYYDKYKRQCFFAKKEPLDYDNYRKEEIKKIHEKMCTQSGQSDIQ